MIVVTIRAKSIIKFDTGQSHLDYEYKAGTSVDAIAKDILHAVVYNKGSEQAAAFFKELLDDYESDFKGCS